MKVGLDFGTTNSIISYFNKEENAVVSHKLGGENASNYISSMVSIDEDEILIGNSAKNAIDSDTRETFAKFKILLETKDTNTLKEHGYVIKNPEEITKTYLEMLINQFEEEKRETVDSIVLTVPELWISDGFSSRTKIKKILEELNKTPKLVSEPISAGAYFLFKYKKEKKKEFNGHILVFDYGGGTLDIALLDTKDDHIKVLERVGKGRNDILTGSAGVAYDEKILDNVSWNKNGIKLSKNHKNYSQLLIDFENNKIKIPIDKRLSYYIKDNDLDGNNPLFTLTYINEMREPILIDIFPSDMVKAFSSFKTEIESSLNRIDGYCKKNKIDTLNSEIFRVIMVGGFSSFYLSKQAVRGFFNAKDDDERFESYFEKEDNALAISKGATLIAENLINIDETYPLTIRLLMKRKDKYGYLVDAPFTPFKKGDNIKSYNPIYLDSKITIAGEIIFEFDYEDGENIFKKRVEKNVKELFPNYNQNNNKWKIGFSSDENNFIYIHIEDKNHIKKRVELGNFLNDMVRE